VTLAQGEEPGRSIARGALWLGLWPKLDALYRRACFQFHFDDQEVAGEISHLLEEEVAGCRFEGPRPVTKVYGTILGNVARELTDRLEEKAKERAGIREAKDEGVAVPPPAERSRAERTEDLFRRLTPLVGERGAELLFRRYYEGEEFGRDRKAEAKAIERALQKIQDACARDAGLARALKGILSHGEG
jgi:hypothetical protein